MLDNTSADKNTKQMELLLQCWCQLIVASTMKHALASQSKVMTH